jgi:hypothetical protein
LKQVGFCGIARFNGKTAIVAYCTFIEKPRLFLFLFWVEEFSSIFIPNLSQFREPKLNGQISRAKFEWSNFKSQLLMVKFQEPSLNGQISRAKFEG